MSWKPEHVKTINASTKSATLQGSFPADGDRDITIKTYPGNHWQS